MVVYFLFLLLALAQASRAPSVVSVTSLGANSDGTNSAATTEAFQRAFASNPKGEIIVPPGTYLIDNSAGPLTINNFSGKLDVSRSCATRIYEQYQGRPAVCRRVRRDHHWAASNLCKPPARAQ